MQISKASSFPLADYPHIDTMTILCIYPGLVLHGGRGASLSSVYVVAQKKVHWHSGIFLTIANL
jgi:hypothetical protein